MHLFYFTYGYLNPCFRMSDQEKASRDMLRDQLVRSLGIANSPDFVEIILPELRNMLEENNTNFKEMCNLQAKIIAAAKVGVAKQNAKHWIEEVEKGFRSMRQKLSARIYQLERDNNVVIPPPVAEPQFQLPISTKSPEGLGEFDGTHANWPQFRDLFIALVGSRNYPNLNKLLYLKKACTGPASLVIRGYEPLQDCYEAAWDALNAIYEDSYAVTQSLIDRLVNMPIARDAEMSELRRIIDTTTSTLRQLCSLDEEVGKWDSIIINLLTKKLPFPLIESWEQHRKRDQRPTLIEFLGFIDARARARMFSSPSLTPTFNLPPKNEKPNNYGTGRNARHIQNISTRYRNPRATFNLPDNRRYQGCKICNKEHRLANCPILLGKNLHERRRTLLQIGVCLNCLRNGHFVAQCNNPGCFKKECNNGKHHWTLCPNANSSKPEPILQAGATANKRKRDD